jgi:AAA15 family ATPase/GTPase
LSFKLKRININNFTKFGNVEFEFASGINIFIGKNGTGKTHLLKLLYAIGLANKGISSIKEKRIFSVIFGDKIKGIFKISEISHLIRNKEKDSEITINYQLIDNPSDFFIQYVGIKDSIESFQDNSDKQSIAFPENIVYLPTQEIITTYQDYISF